MATSSFKIKKYINGVGFYGMIDIDVNSIESSSSLKIEFNQIYVESEWHLPVEFGIKFFFEHFTKRTNEGLNVCIKNLHTMVEDSSYIVIFFITVKCLCEALEYPHSLIDFDETQGNFSIKK